MIIGQAFINMFLTYFVNTKKAKLDLNFICYMEEYFTIDETILN